MSEWVVGYKPCRRDSKTSHGRGCPCSCSCGRWIPDGTSKDVLCYAYSIDGRIVGGYEKMFYRACKGME
jgi:hypothetical protein